ncbi:GNAT family N-acetyltransferase, partial [Moraxella sp.]
MNVSLIEGGLVTKDYLEKLARLESELFDDAWDVLAISSVLSGFGAGVIVVESDQEVLGYCIYQAVFEVAEILRIATAKHCQKNGIGSLILNHLASHCIEKQAERILLEVRADNLAAIALYK